MGKRISKSFTLGSGAVGVFLAVPAFFLACFCATRAEAIPAFSREYKTECTTCHTIFPQRNEFGRAFEDNGFIWPGAVALSKKVKVAQTEEERKSAEFIKLSGIPKTLPVSLITRVSYAYDNNDYANASDKKEDQFDQKRYSAEILVSGALAERIGFWFNESLGSQASDGTGDPTGPTGPSELYFVVRHPFEAPLYLRAGRFQPSLSLWKGSDHLISRPLSMGASVGGFALSNANSGLELSSFLGPRVLALVGMTDRNNSSDSKNPHSVNDWYGRVGVRIGGGDYLGNEPDVDLDKDSVWDYLGLTAGAFYFKGTSSAGDGVDRDLLRYGAEAGLSYKKFLLMLGATKGQNNPSATVETDSTALSAEANYVFNPMLALAVRYDRLKVDGKDDRTLVTPGIIYAPLQCFTLALRVMVDSNPKNAATDKGKQDTTATLTASWAF